MTPPDPLVTVLVPTHEHHETLDLSVRSILGQTMDDLVVVIIGDGATREVADVAASLCSADGRVRFEDHPKTPRSGELLRDRIIRSVDSRFIAYNCDDDLWLPHHLETMIELIGASDFIHPYPVLIGADGAPFVIPSDLQRPESVSWHLTEKPRNSISLSGVVHTRAAYLRLPHGWRDTPAGRWTDHYMWQQFFEQPWFTGVTSPVSTTLKLMAEVRDGLAPGARRSDIQSWWDRMHSPGFAEEWTAMVDRAVRHAAVTQTVVAAHQEDIVVDLGKRLDDAHHALQASIAAQHDMQVRLEDVHRALHESRLESVALGSRLSRLRERVTAMEKTVSWRLTRPLRILRGLNRRRG